MVTYFDSSMAGSPVMSGSASALLAVLNACLVTGFGTQSATSLVVSAGVATVSLPAVHGLQVNAYVRIAGATPAGLNGDWPVTSAASQSFTFATTEASGTATGSITAKHAPLGWAQVFTGTNKAVFRSADVTGTRMYLRVDDSSTISARVTGYESMSDVDTGISPFPTGTQFSGGNYWYKSKVANASARDWMIIGDGRLFYIYFAPDETYQDAGNCFAFGDFVSLKTGDPYSCLINGSDSTSYNGIPYGDISRSSTWAQYPTAFLARSYSGIGGSQPYYSGSAFGAHNFASGVPDYCSTDLLYPNGPDNSLITAPVCINSNFSMRGFFPGAYHTPQSCQSSFNSRDKVAGSGVHAGKTFMVLRCGHAVSTSKNTSGNTGAGVLFIDITGPWR